MADSLPSSQAAGQENAGDATVPPGFMMIIRRCGPVDQRLLATVLATTAALSFLIGAAFAWLGLWLVLPFVGLEVAVLGIAWWVHTKHARDAEMIRMDGRQFMVEVRRGRRLYRHELNLHWAQCRHELVGGRERLLIGSHGRYVEIGRQLDRQARRRIGEDLNERLRRFRGAA